MATTVPDTIIRAVRDNNTVRRSRRAVTPAMTKLVSTAKTPEIEMACPARPSVIRRSDAIGVNRLTGMNSEAMSTMTHSAMDSTAPRAPARRQRRHRCRAHARSVVRTRCRGTCSSEQCPACVDVTISSANQSTRDDPNWVAGKICKAC